MLRTLANIMIFTKGADEQKPLTGLNQALIERGISPPWVWSEAKCTEYWKSKAGDDEGNKASFYLNKDTKICHFLADFLNDHNIPKDAKILEIGCNVGTNLNVLMEMGYRNVHGIEISQEAVSLMKESYPNINQENIVVGNAVDVLHKMEADSMDVIFTMAVLMHIHPSSSSLFNEMVRVSKSRIITIEPENASTCYIFPRNYKRVFERLGCTQTASFGIKNGFDRMYCGYTTRLFKKTKVKV